MGDFYLAVDIGASSGRHILSYYKNGKIHLEEIHRFENGVAEKDGQLCWNYDNLFQEILIGLKKCKTIGKTPKSISIDTWAVDFVLLDNENKVIGNTVSYRDDRTANIDKKVYKYIKEDELYKRTGIQKQVFNSIYQLMAIKETTPEYLEKAKTMLLVPDYFHFLLTGEKKTEYTNATTTQLVSVETNDWDFDLINKLGYKEEIFTDIILPKETVGNFSDSIIKEVGFDCKVVACATHDTGSAVVSIPYADDKSLFISSGTWSLMGIELEKANTSKESRALNFTNEGGYDYRFRYLKNIMGLWIIQNVRKELNNKYSFAELCAMAESSNIETTINCDDSRLLSPKSMIETIKLLSSEKNQKVPETPSEIAKVVYTSLAIGYKKTINEIENITGNKYENIYIVGGGAKADYLNNLTAKHTKRKVVAVPIEATALGNILVQMIADGVFKDIFEARKCVKETFDVKIFE